MKSLLLSTAVALSLNAITAEAAMKVDVNFTSAGQTLAGDLYLPDSYQPGDKLPGVVVTGAWTSVKEQMAGLYAAELADRGYAALAFDFRGWGQSSGGEPFLEDPARKTEDIHAAVNFLATRQEVASAQIAGLGVCASAGYMSDAALENPNLKSIALVAPWLHNADIVEAVYGGKEGVSQLLQAAETAARAAEPIIIEAASQTNESALMYQAPYYTETDRGLIPEYDNKFNVASWQGWLTYDGLKTAEELHKPVLLIHSEAAAIPQGAKAYASAMGSSATAIWLPNVTQFDFYDRKDVVSESTEAVAAHFAQTLK